MARNKMGGIITRHTIAYILDFYVLFFFTKKSNYFLISNVHYFYSFLSEFNFIDVYI